MKTRSRRRGLDAPNKRNPCAGEGRDGHAERRQACRASNLQSPPCFCHACSAPIRTGVTCPAGFTASPAKECRTMAPFVEPDRPLAEFDPPECACARCEVTGEPLPVLDPPRRAAVAQPVGGQRFQARAIDLDHRLGRRVHRLRDRRPLPGASGGRAWPPQSRLAPRRWPGGHASGSAPRRRRVQWARRDSRNRIGRSGCVVTKPRGTTVPLPNGSMRKARSSRASTSVASVSANWAPMHTRGPAPKGM